MHFKPLDDRFRLKARSLQLAEINRGIERLASREDHFPELDYFLDLCADMGSPKKVSYRTGRRVAALWCLQAPVELAMAAGFQPLRYPGGCVVPQSLSKVLGLTADCPMARAVFGSLMAQSIENGDKVAALVFPSNCG